MSFSCRNLKRLQCVLAVIFVLFLGFGDLGLDAQTLDPLEVAALRVIAARLNKTDWDFDVDPCGGSRSWFTDPGSDTIFANNLTCGDCNNSICHVVSLELKGQNLTGSLPAEFANLTSLAFLDLTRNYLNGSIPTDWASLPLVELDLLGNRISGTIPRELGSIITLTSLVIEDNSLGGPIPPELGNLVNLRRFLASANNFTGPLPESLGLLRNLTDFRIDGSSLTGRIPEFIANWTRLDRLDMQGTSLDGPLPVAFSRLENLTELRVSDLGGPSNTFPSLERMSMMEDLILRNCSIIGPIPEYVGSMRDLKTLDLSFNQLTGTIPSTFEGLEALDYMYLTNNNLTGDIPSWILRSEQNMDISYNTFTGSPSPPACPAGNLNYVASYSSSDNTSITPCLRRNFPCSTRARNYQVFINCGGGSHTYGDRVYEDDSVRQGTAAFYSSDNWAHSSTGDFTGRAGALYVVSNTSEMTSSGTLELYTTACTAPISLKYYGLCLQEGNYTVGLHFAENIFTNHPAFSSVGRRIFDVSIQGEMVLRNFDIVREAGGAGIGIVRNFTTLVRSPSYSLEIHLYWAGKGTTAIPDRGVYGPLISAITVTPNFEPDLGNDDGGLSVGAIVGITIAACVFVALVGIFIWFVFFKKDPKDNELQGLELQTGYFTLRQIKAATQNFDSSNKIGEGGFGPVHKGTLPDGSMIAVKQLSAKSKQGNREFINEVGMISALQHPNLVKLFGCCVEGNQLLVVYEYMENNSLARALFGRKEDHLHLDWPTRRKICIGIAKGLAYLHEESRLKIVHRDIKATNVLLDKNLNAKISDFGLAKLTEDEDTHISTRIAGTIGYMAPEYAMRGYLTDKADVYSYGIVLLEIVSGMSNTNYRPKEDFVYLLDWAYVLQEKGSLIELVDTNLGQDFVVEEALKILTLALICTNPSFTLRPTMSSVVSVLEGQTKIVTPAVMPSSSIDNARFKSLNRLSQDDFSHTISKEAPWAYSSNSAPRKDESDIASFHASTSRLLSKEPDLIDV